MTHTKLIAFFLLSVISLTMSTSGAMARLHESRGQNPDVVLLVDSLWEEDDIPAKIEILKAGTSAEPYLISLLGDLIKDREQKHLAPDGQRLDKPMTRPGGNRAAGRPDLVRRVTDDCVVLLGHLKAADAVPLILKLLESEPFHMAEPSCGLEMAALEEIGAPAVVPVIDALENADLIAARIPGGSARLIRGRTCLVLIDLGDPRAIPALESLIAPGAEFENGPQIQKAIDRMRGNQSR